MIFFALIRLILLMNKNTNLNNTKYIFVTGGVVSGIGKGICAASIGNILKSSGYNISALKMDPYLNIDPGTMSPYEHGEVYVLADGSETDLDLGNYERFLDTELDKNSSISSGSIFQNILDKERKGDYLGKTVQIIPHVTDYIQEQFAITKSDNQIKIIEIGGSTGDIEAEVFLESLRQFKIKHQSQILHIHLGYIPYLKVVGEYKSKPLQNSTKELLKKGLQPDVIVIRYEEQEGKTFSNNFLEKIALYCNTQVQNIIQLPDLDSIYQSPKFLLDNSNILQVLNVFLKTDLKPQLNKFFLESLKKHEKTIKIALIAKYSGLSDSYLSVIESLKIASSYNKINIVIDILDSEELDFDNLGIYDGFVVPGGFGSRGLEQKIKAITYIRENKKPFLGICLGMQMAVVEYLSNICDVKNAISREMQIEENENYEFCIDLMPDQINKNIKGASMRLGNYGCTLKSGTLTYDLYNKKEIIERHRHRLEVQNKYVELLENNKMIISGKHYPDTLSQEYLVEIIELDQSIHPYFVATQAHPEFLSRPNRPHPLFDGLIKACKKSLQ